MKNINNTNVETGYVVLTKDRTKGIFVNYNTLTYTYHLTDNLEKVTILKARFSAENVAQRYIEKLKKKQVALEVVPVKVTTRHQVDLEEVTEEELTEVTR